MNENIPMLDRQNNDNLRLKLHNRRFVPELINAGSFMGLMAGIL